MGCGSSRSDHIRAEIQRNSALADHLYSILGLEPVSKDVAEYVARLRAEGFDSPEDLDQLAIAKLAAKP